MRKEWNRNPFFLICRKEIIIFVHSKLESLYFLQDKKMFSKISSFIIIIIISNCLFVNYE